MPENASGIFILKKVKSLLEFIKIFLFLHPLQTGYGEVPEWPKGPVC
jgi:hypothetical protein